MIVIKITIKRKTEILLKQMEELAMSKKIVLAGACRTAIGTMGGALSTTPAPVLGSIVIKEALKRAGVAPESGSFKGWTSYRNTSSYSKRCMWFWSELCKHGCTDDQGRRC